MRFLIGGVTIVIVYNFLQVSSLPHRISIRSVDDAGCENDECRNAIDKLNVSSLNSLNQYPCQTQPSNEQSCTFFIEQFLNTLYKLYNPNCHYGKSNVWVIIEKESEAKPSKEENNDNVVQTIPVKAIDDIPLGDYSFDNNLSSELRSKIPCSKIPPLTTSARSTNDTSELASPEEEIVLPQSPPTHEPTPGVTVSIPIESAENKDDTSEQPATNSVEINTPANISNKGETIQTSNEPNSNSFWKSLMKKFQFWKPEVTESIPIENRKNNHGTSELLVTTPSPVDEIVSSETSPTNVTSTEEVASVLIESEGNNDDTSDPPVVNPVEINPTASNSNKEETMQSSKDRNSDSFWKPLMKKLQFWKPEVTESIPIENRQNNDGTSELLVTTPSPVDEIVSHETPPTNERTAEVVSTKIDNGQNNDGTSEPPVTTPRPDGETVVTVSSQANESEPKANAPELTTSIPIQEDKTILPELLLTNQSSPEKVVSVPIKSEENNDETSELPVVNPVEINLVSNPSNKEETLPTSNKTDTISLLGSLFDNTKEYAVIPQSEENNDGTSELPVTTLSPDDEIVVTISSQANESEPNADEPELTTSIPSQEDETMSPESPPTNESSPEEVVSVPIESKENNDETSEPPVTTPRPDGETVVTVSSQANESEPKANAPELTTSIPIQEDKTILPELLLTNQSSPEKVVSVPIKSEENNDETSELPVVNPVEINLVSNPSNTEETLPTSNKTDPISLLGYLFDNAKAYAVIPQREENNDDISEPPVTTPSPVDEIVVTVSSQANESEPTADELELTTSIPSQEDKIVVLEPPPTNEPSPEEVVSVPIKSEENNDETSELPVVNPVEINLVSNPSNTEETLPTSNKTDPVSLLGYLFDNAKGDAVIPQSEENNDGTSEPPVTTPSPVDEIVVTESSQTNESEPKAAAPELTTSILSQEDETMSPEPAPTNESSPEEVVSTKIDNGQNNDGTSEPPVTTLSPDNEIVVTVSSQANESEPTADEPEFTTSIPRQEDEIVSSKPPPTNEPSPEEVVSVPIKSEENNDETSELPVITPSPGDEIVVTESSQTNESEPKADAPELTTSIPSQEDETISPEPPLTNESSPEEVVSVPIKSEENNDETSELPVVNPVEINLVSNPSNKEETLPTSNKTDTISLLGSLFDNTKEYAVIPQSEENNDGTSELLVTTLSPDDEIVVTISSQANESEPNADEPELTTSIPNQEDEIVVPEPPPTNESSPEEVVSVPIKSEENNDETSELPVITPSPVDEIVVTESSQTNESEPKAAAPELTTSIPSQEDETMSPEPAPTNESSPEEVVSVPIKSEENNDETSELPVVNPVEINLVSNPSNTEETLPTSNKTDPISLLGSLFDNTKEYAVIPQSEENNDGTSELPVTSYPSPDGESVVTVSSQANKSEPTADEPILKASIPSLHEPIFTSILNFLAKKFCCGIIVIA